uniref:Uncharacterized protein n=1 Tax=Quercus lobata TaxID=97700 RepID=A0A7N2KWR9_QUELO
MRFSNGVLHWEIQFCREVHNRELEAFRSFINSIYSTLVRGIEEDKRFWLPCKSKGFTPVSTKGKPTKLHKRKHQIGSLFYDMKQKEMELTERRAKGFLTKAETQAKYGW